MSNTSFIDEGAIDLLALANGHATTDEALILLIDNVGVHVPRETPTNPNKVEKAEKAKKKSSRYTGIQWATDTCNPVSGCFGCELRPRTLTAALVHPMARGEMEKQLLALGRSWTDDADFGNILQDLPPATKEFLLKKVQVCYAGKVVEAKGKSKEDGMTRKGWPDSFDKPRSWDDRMAAIVGKKDLRGVPIDEKPWLDPALPRIVFVGSMGDTFSPSIPFEKIYEQVLLPILSANGQRHFFIVLTKQPGRLLRFTHWLRRVHGIGLPDNVMVGTSVTYKGTRGRVSTLLKVPARWRMVSFEPVWEYVDLRPFLGEGKIDLLIVGGESGSIATPVELDTLRRLRDDAKDRCHFFLKQLGENVMENGNRLKFKDQHAGDWSEWPEDLRVRQFPNV